MDSLALDLRHAARLLLRRPAWSLAALLTLGLGMGATTAIWSVVQNVLLRPLPYPEADRLVAVSEVDAGSGEGLGVLTFPGYEAWRDGQSVLPALGPYATQTHTLNRPEGAERVASAVVAAATLEALGVRPLRGRSFLPADDLEGAEPVVLLSHAAWRDRFGSREDVVGSTITLNERPRTVVGVMPPDFRFPTAGTELWVPLAAAHRGPGTAYLFLLARLPEGVGIEAARAGLAASPRTEAEPGESAQELRLEIRPFRETVLGDVGPLLLVFLGAVTVLLLVASLNVANLMLVRAAERERELTVRTALGAGRARLVRQHLTEGLALAGGAALLGVLLAVWLVEGLSALDLGTLPRAEEVRVDPLVLAFTAVLATLVGLGVGMAPALRTMPGDVMTRLRTAGLAATEGMGSRRVRSALVVAQVALATALLAAGGLLVRSFIELRSRDSGFAVERVATIGVLLPGTRYGEITQMRAFYDELLQRLGATPELGSAAVASFLPFSPARSIYDLEIAGRPQPEDTPAEVVFVSPAYFEVMGVALRGGRELLENDGEGDLPVVVVNETLARRHWRDESPVGGRIRLEDDTWRTVVGVVADTRQHGLDTEPAPQVFVPYAQAGEKWPFGMAVVASLSGDLPGAAAAARAIIASMDPNVPVSGVRRLSDLRSAYVAGPRLRALLVGGFALAALLLATIGVYGVMAYTTASRTRELGIRMALGATGGRIVRSVVRQGLSLALAGIALGMAGALLLGRVLERWLFGVGVRDPLTLLAIVAVLGSTALLAAWVPARRAARLEPVRALRGE